MSPHPADVEIEAWLHECERALAAENPDLTGIHLSLSMFTYDSRKIGEQIATALANCSPNTGAYEVFKFAEGALAHLEEIRTPGLVEFLDEVEKEAQYQRGLHGEEDDLKTPDDWRQALDYLETKLICALKIDGDHVKARHHCITIAALMHHWHQHIEDSLGGIHDPDEESSDAEVDRT